ncbi:MAG: tol-pal system protein YbgF [Thermoanaerobaculia bacterium]
MKRLTLLLVPLCLAAGCAGSALRPDDTQQQEIQALKTRILELQREAAMNQVELSQLRQRVAEMEARNGGAPRPATPPSTVRPAPPPTPLPRSGAVQEDPKMAPRPLAPAPAPIRPAPSTPAPAQTRRTEPERPVTRPAEPIEEVDIALPETGPQPPPRRAPATSAPKPAAPKPAAPAGPAPSNPEPSASPDGLSPATQALYDRGYTLFNQGRFVDAEASFQRFLQANPGNELADNAQYWIGECRYSRNDIKGALAAFRAVVEKFPKGNKVPDAMLKSGQCLEAMGDVEGARVTYREVNRRFPGTAAAAVAEERRAKLP